jgi:hypothetical protein
LLALLAIARVHTSEANLRAVQAAIAERRDTESRTRDGSQTKA